MLAQSTDTETPGDEDQDDTSAKADLKEVSLTFQALKNDELRHYTHDHESIIKQSHLESLELFSNPHRNPEQTVLTHIDRTHTTAGRLTLARLLATPTTNQAVLQKRQETIARLVTDDAVYNKLSALLKAYAPHEKACIALKDPDNELYQDAMMNLVYPDGYFTNSLLLQECGSSTYMIVIFWYGLP